MRAAHDLYAERNPAFGTYAVASFVHAFAETEPQGADLPIVYIVSIRQRPLPIGLSSEVGSVWVGCVEACRLTGDSRRIVRLVADGPSS